MALREPQFRSSGDPKEVSDAEELEELEADVKDMAKKLLHYRTTLPVQLKSKFTSILSSQRPPNLEFVSGSEPQASGDSGQFSVFFFFFLNKVWLLQSMGFIAVDKESRNIRLIEASTSVWVSCCVFEEQKISPFFVFILFYFVFLLFHEPSGSLEFWALGKQIGLGTAARSREFPLSEYEKNIIFKFIFLTSVCCPMELQLLC